MQQPQRIPPEFLKRVHFVVSWEFIVPPQPVLTTRNAQQCYYHLLVNATWKNFPSIFHVWYVYLQFPYFTLKNNQQMQVFIYRLSHGSYGFGYVASGQFRRWQLGVTKPQGVDLKGYTVCPVCLHQHVWDGIIFHHISKTYCSKSLGVSWKQTYCMFFMYFVLC